MVYLIKLILKLIASILVLIIVGILTIPTFLVMLLIYFTQPVLFNIIKENFKKQTSIE